MNNMYTNNINNLGMCPKCKKYLTGILVKKKYDETKNIHEKMLKPKYVGVYPLCLHKTREYKDINDIFFRFSTTNIISIL